MRFFAMDDIEWNSTSIAQETRCAGWVAPMLRPYINSRNRRIVSISSTDLSGRKLTMRARPSAPRPHELRALAATLPKAAWTRPVITEGNQGPIVAQFVFLRVRGIRHGLPGPRVWTVFRRQIHPEPELKFYLSNAPATCSRAERVRVRGLR